MAFYIGEIRRMRKEFIEAYKDGDYKKALILGKGILNIYVENDDMDYSDYVIDDIHFFLFLSFCWVRSSLLYWAWGSLRYRV